MKLHQNYPPFQKGDKGGFVGTSTTYETVLSFEVKYHQFPQGSTVLLTHVCPTLNARFVPLLSPGSKCVRLLYFESLINIDFFLTMHTISIFINFIRDSFISKWMTSQQIEGYCAIPTQNLCSCEKRGELWLMKT